MKRIIFNTQKISKSLLSKVVINSLVLILMASAAMAQGDLLISPLRIVFEGPKKSQEISLANVGKDTSTYSVSVVNIRMREDGSFEEITVPDSGQNFAGEYLRFFPRKVTLAPNEAQVVKVQVIKANMLAPGEYRSHVYFRAVPDEKAVPEKPKEVKELVGKEADSINKSTDTGSISIALKPIYGITIPVIIRVGENNGDVALSDVAFNMADQNPILSFSFNRLGNMSVYGDIKVEYVVAGEKPTQVKLVKGVGIYTPNKVRHLNIALDKVENVDFHKGKLMVTYTLQTNDKTPKTVQTEVALN